MSSSNITEMPPDDPTRLARDLADGYRNVIRLVAAQPHKVRADIRRARAAVRRAGFVQDRQGRLVRIR